MASLALETSAHELDGAVELGTRPLRRAPGQEIGGEVGQARRVRRIEGRAGPHGEPDHHDGDGRALRHQEHGAVVENLAVGERGRFGARCREHRERHTEHRVDEAQGGSSVKRRHFAAAGAAPGRRTPTVRRSIWK